MPKGKAEKTLIYLVDDHPLMRESLASLIAQEPDLAICGESDNALRAEREIIAKKPDLAIVDISLNGSSGFDLRPQPELKMSAGVAWKLHFSLPSFRLIAMIALVLVCAGGELLSPVPK